jgi:molybdopterin-guanine dinucleotide biosynthesis protein A
MGSPKAELDWHGSTLLRRVTGILARAVSPSPVIVVSAPGQALPAVGAGVEVVADAVEGRGPLQGLAAGLAAIGGRADVAYVSSVDVPLLHPAFVRAVASFALDGEVDVAVPEAGGRRHALSAAYRVSVRGVVEELLSDDRLALGALLGRCRLRCLAGAELPDLRSLTNLNEPGEYKRALALPAPEVRVDGSLARAWRLGDVLGDRSSATTLNGEPVDPDPEVPLVTGDVVALVLSG